MRFIADGPAIPQELLELRDSGEVVFFCGAGVSMPAGLPSFLQLAELVLRGLNVAEDAPGRRLLGKIRTALNDQDHDAVPPLDQLMGVLQREYGAFQVESHVRKHLRPKGDATTRYHETILRLATDPRRATRLVTTNFDQLFELARPNLRIHTPPVFPSLHDDDPLDGLVYLHGRLTHGKLQGSHQVQGLVLGSSDFGRAYLADGRTLRFVSQLVKRHVVVFLGYSADDPPIRYLLEGLTSLGDGSSRAMYAFVDLSNPAMFQRWRDRGVEPIGYEKRNNDHSGLWATLEAWSKRAQNPHRWRSRVLKRAALGPASLQSYERGQVASVVRSRNGARAFFETSPALPATWICSFDPLLRYARVATKLDPRDPTEEFDPLTAFGLDDDPPRPTEPNWLVPQDAIDVLSSLPEDGVNRTNSRLAGNFSGTYSALPPRLADLTRWIGRVSSDPVIAWWTAHYLNLDPAVESEIRSSRNSDEDASTGTNEYWKLYLELDRRALRDNEYDLMNLLEASESLDGQTADIASFSV